MMVPMDMGVISKSLADRILALDPAQFTYTLYGTLEKDQVEAARVRLENMKEAIQNSRQIVASQKQKNPNMDEKWINVPFGHLREIKDDEWKRVKKRQLYRIPAGLDPAEEKQRIMQRLDDYPKDRIKAIDLITETFRNRQNITPDEEAALKANHRKAVEDTVREIRKNPGGPAAGPKNIVQKKVVKKAPAL